MDDVRARIEALISSASQETREVMAKTYTIERAKLYMTMSGRLQSDTVKEIADAIREVVK